MSKVDELRAKYPRVTTSVFNKFVDGDKTKTKKYLAFMLKTWVDRTSEISTSNELVQLVNMFDELLPYIENKDIYHKEYENITHFLSVLNKAMADKEEKTFIREEHADVIEENDEYILLNPKTHRGSLKYGANTKWCTASKNNPNTFSSYSKNGFLAYLISKKEKISNHEKVAFYVRKNEDSLTGEVEVYLTNDSTTKSQNLIQDGKWGANTIFEIITKVRLKAYSYHKVVDAKNKIDGVINTLSNIKFDNLTESIDVLEKMNNIDYISKAKKEITDFVSKLEKIKI